MFGHMGSDQVRQKPTVSGQRSARVPKPQPDPNSSLASSADLNQEAFSFTTSPPRFRSVSPSVQDLSQEDSLQESLADDLDSQHNVPLPRSRPPREGGSLRLSRNDVQRLSRVLDEIVTDYTQGPQRTTTPPPSESIHVGPQPRDFIYTNLHARSSSRALLQDENAEEEVDPLLSRSRKTSPNLSLIDAPSTSQGMLTPSSLDASADSNSLLAKTPTPPPHASPDVPQSATNTPTQQNTGDIPSVNAPHTLSPRFREPSLYTTSESMFPSPVSSPQKSAAAAADHSSWKQQSRALDSSAAVGRSQLMSSRFGQGRIASEETDLSTAPSGYFSPRLATRRSNSSLGSSFCEESSLPDALSLSEELVWQDECPSELPRRPSSTSVTSAAPSAISRGESIPTTSGSSAIVHDRTMGFGLTHDPQTTSLHLTELERDQCLRGLRMSDLTAFQSKLVASASEQSGGRIAYDPSPGISQRAIFDFVGPTPQPHRATESELDAEDTEHLHIHHTESATCSNDSEPLHTPSLVGSGESPITDLSAPSTPPAGQVLHWDFRHPFSSLSDDRNSKGTRRSCFSNFIRANASV